MCKTTFRNLHQQLRKLYDTKDYAQALALIEKEQAAFPENVYEIAYWRLCLNAVLGNATEALHIFHEIVDQGGWFSPTMLEQDPDLVDLRSLPGFQKMVAICRQRLADSKDLVQPELLVARPVEHATALPLLIALHGNEENARNTIGEWNGITGQGWLLGVPTSSQIVGPNEFVWDERETGISEVREHLATLNSEHRINPECVVLGGYSMGGGLAVWMALQQSIKTRGFVVLAPYLTPAELEALRTLLESQKPTDLRGSILVGEEDVTCLEVSRMVVDIMRTHHLPCELEIHPGTDHSYPPNFGEYISKGLAFVEQV